MPSAPRAASSAALRRRPTAGTRARRRRRRGSRRAPAARGRGRPRARAAAPQAASRTRPAPTAARPRRGRAERLRPTRACARGGAVCVCGGGGGAGGLHNARRRAHRGLHPLPRPRPAAPARHRSLSSAPQGLQRHHGGRVSDCRLRQARPSGRDPAWTQGKGVVAGGFSFSCGARGRGFQGARAAAPDDLGLREGGATTGAPRGCVVEGALDPDLGMCYPRQRGPTYEGLGRRQGTNVAAQLPRTAEGARAAGRVPVPRAAAAGAPPPPSPVFHLRPRPAAPRPAAARFWPPRWAGRAPRPPRLPARAAAARSPPPGAPEKRAARGARGGGRRRPRRRAATDRRSRLHCRRARAAAPRRRRPCVIAWAGANLPPPAAARAGVFVFWDLMLPVPIAPSSLVWLVTNDCTHGTAWLHPAIRAASDAAREPAAAAAAAAAAAGGRRRPPAVVGMAFSARRTCPRRRARAQRRHMGAAREARARPSLARGGRRTAGGGTSQPRPVGSLAPRGMRTLSW